VESEEVSTSAQDESTTSQMPAVPPLPSQLEPVVWPEDPYEADGRAAEEQPAPAPVVTTPVIPAWPEGVAGEPSVPSHEPVRPGGDEPVTAPFLAMKTQPPAPGTEDEHDTVPPAPADEVETADAKLESLAPEVEAAGEAGVEAPAPVIDEAAIAEEVDAVEAPASAVEAEAEAEGEPEIAAAEPVAEAEPAQVAEPDPETETEPEPQPEPDAPPAEPVQEPGPEPEPVKAEEPEPAPEPEPQLEPAVEAMQPVEPATPAPATPVWAAQTAPAPAQPQVAAPAAAYQPPVNPPIPSWAPVAPNQTAAPVPDAPTQWPGVNVPAWAPQATASHPGTANPLPKAGGVYADPVRASAPAPAPSSAPVAPTPTPAAQPAPTASAPTSSAPTAPAIPAPTTGSQPGKAKTSSSSWEVVDQKRQETEHKPQGPTAEDKSYAEWFAWAKRSGAPASACHAAAQGAFRALAAGNDMNTAVQWATLAMASPPGLVGQSRQLYCAWYSLGNIDLKLPTPQAHAFAQGAISALEQGADSMSAHQAGLMAAGITGG